MNFIEIIRENYILRDFYLLQQGSTMSEEVTFVNFKFSPQVQNAARNEHINDKTKMQAEIFKNTNLPTSFM